MKCMTPHYQFPPRYLMCLIHVACGEKFVHAYSKKFIAGRNDWNCCHTTELGQKICPAFGVMCGWYGFLFFCSNLWCRVLNLVIWKLRLLDWVNSYFVMMWWKHWLSTWSVYLSGFLTAVTVFRKPNAIPLCFSIDLVLNFLLSWLLVLLPSVFFLDVLFTFSPIVSNP